MNETFEPYLDGKPGDWVVFSPEHGSKTKGFWDREMILCIHQRDEAAKLYYFEVNKLHKRYPHLKYYTGGCSNQMKGFRKALPHEIPGFKSDIIDTYQIY